MLGVALAAIDPQQAVQVARSIEDPGNRSGALGEIAEQVARSNLQEALEIKMETNWHSKSACEIAGIVSIGLEGKEQAIARMQISEALDLFFAHVSGENKRRTSALLLLDVAKHDPGLAETLMQEIVMTTPWVNDEMLRERRLAELVTQFGVADRLQTWKEADSLHTSWAKPRSSADLEKLTTQIVPRYPDEDDYDRLLTELPFLSIRHQLDSMAVQRVLVEMVDGLDRLSDRHRERLAAEIATIALRVDTDWQWLSSLLERLLAMLHMSERQAMFHLRHESVVIGAQSWLLSQESSTQWWCFACDELHKQCEQGSDHAIVWAVAQFPIVEQMISLDTPIQLQEARDRVAAFLTAMAPDLTHPHTHCVR